MKKNKIIVTLLVIMIVLLVGIIGFGGYKYMELQKDNDKLTSENKNITEELNKQKEEKTSATNDYSLFVKKMKEERQKLFNSETLNVDFYESVSTYSNNKGYGVNLTGDGVLQLIIGEKKTEVAKNVLLYRVVYLGNGAYKSLFYITEDGFVYVANVEEVVVGNGKLKSVKQKSAKEIVAIIPGGSGEIYKDENGKTMESPGAAHPFFVDINGNIYPYEYNE